MTLTDILLAAVGSLLAAIVGLSIAWAIHEKRQWQELFDTLNALAEMLGEEIDRREHGKTN